MPLLSHRIISDPRECKQLWEVWSPKASLYDLWEYRQPFLDVYAFPLAFTVFSDGTDEIGMLPLWHDTTANRYRWLGDVGDEFDWQEDTAFWVRDPSYVPAMLQTFAHPLSLTALTPVAAEQIGPLPGLIKIEAKSVLPLKNIHSVEDYLMQLPKKLRQNTRREWRRVTERNPELVRDDRSHFADLLRLNTATFADSPFHDPRLCSVFSAITRQQDPNTYQVYFFTLKVDGMIVGVDCIFFWNHCYYPLLCGYDKTACPGIGYYMNLVDLEHALTLGAERMDFGEIERGTLKEKQFPLIDQYRYATT